MGPFINRLYLRSRLLSRLLTPPATGLGLAQFALLALAKVLSECLKVPTSATLKPTFKTLMGPFLLPWTKTADDPSSPLLAAPARHGLWLRILAVFLRTDLNMTRSGLLFSPCLSMRLPLTIMTERLMLLALRLRMMTL